MSTGPFRIGEHVQVSEWPIFDESDGFVELYIGFTGETGHDVGAYASIRHQAVREIEARGIMTCAIFPEHSFENGIRARLQRNVDMLRDARLARHQFQHFGAPIHRFHRTDANSLYARVPKNRTEQVREA